MSTMTYKGYTARIEYDDEDEIFVGHLVEIDDIIGFHADTVDGLKTAFRETVDDYLIQDWATVLAALKGASDAAESGS
jgi:predicted HicB family RNase H-like nuclease